MIKLNTAIGYKEWVTIRELVFNRHRFLDFFLSSENFFKAKPTKIVGSAYMFYRDSGAFYDVLKFEPIKHIEETLRASDIDVCLKYDPFFIERLSTLNPNFLFRELEKDEYDTTNSNLRVVYETNVRSLVEGFPLGTLKAMKYMSEVSEHPNMGADLLDTKVQLLFVKDLDITTTVWESMDSQLFAKKLWKKSPSFIGAESQKSLFNLLEKVAKVAKRNSNATTTDKTSVTDDQVIGMPDWEVFNGVVEDIGVPEPVAPAPVAVQGEWAQF